MSEKHFGKELAKAIGIDLEALNADVRHSKNEQIKSRLHLPIIDNLIYIKNSYEYYKDTPVHFFKYNKQKDDDEYNEKIAVYQALTKLKNNPSLDNATDLEDYFLFYDEIQEFLFENELIESYEYADTFWDHVYEINTYEEIKEFLEDEKIDSSGDKRDLVERMKKLHMYEELGEFYFKLSKKGVEYYNSVSWIGFYLIFLDNFDFYEFEEFMDGNFMNSALEFLDKHAEIALKKNDLTRQYDVQSSKALYYIVNRDWRNALDEEVKLFITRLNPVFQDDDELVFHESINQVNVGNLINLLEVCDIEDTERLFRQNWDKLDLKKPLISKEKSLKYFKDALNGMNVEELRHDADTYYFND